MNGRAKNYLALFVGLAVVLILPNVIYPVLALDILLWGLLAISVDLLLGYVGLLSFGHAAYWGAGGYTAAIVSKTLRVPFPLAALTGIAVAALLALPIGYLSIRRRAIYFAMVTLAFAQMVFYIVNEWRDLTGGENGVQGVPRLFPGLNLTSPLAFYYAALPIILFALWFVNRIVHSPFGHVLVSIRDNEPRAQALGYPTRYFKLLAFVLSAALAGLAGSLFALGHGFAALDLVHWSTSGTAVVMTILGGIGTLWGNLLGAAIFLFLRDWLSTLANVQGGLFQNLKDAPDIVTGATFVLVVLGFRRGLWVTLREIPERVRKWSRRPADTHELASD